MISETKNTVHKPLHTSATERELARLSERYRLSAVYAFGSRATEVAALVGQKSNRLMKSARDVDIAILPHVQVVLSVREKVEIALEFEELFGASRVDLLSLPEADPFLAANAIRGERIYCRDDDLADEYELFVLRRAGDLIPLERERIRLIMEDKA
jgi:predicted nucleotidyltransferase